MIRNKQLLTETNIINDGLVFHTHYMHVLYSQRGFSVHIKTPSYEPCVITLIKAYSDFSSASEKVMHI